MVYLLTSFGHQTLEAHEGSEGIEIARLEKPDLILLDIHMPRMDGYEVARRLNADPECHKIPIVAVTALAMVGDREKILASGFDGYIAKPLDPEMFASQVQGFLSGSPPSRPLSVQDWSEPAFPAAEPQLRNGALILLVDDTKSNLDLERTVLEPSGYEVVTASSVNEGYALAKKNRPDLILSDVHMLRQNGFDFLQMMRADPDLARIPFVFLTSSVLSRDERDRALLLGATKYISRPIEPQKLLSEIESCLQHARKS